MKTRIIFLLICLICAVSCVFDDPKQDFELKVGDSIPEFTVLMSDGTVMKSTDLNAGVSLIMFLDLKQIIDILMNL